MTEQPPVLGDIRYCNPERDGTKDLRDVTDFEIWNGERWVHASEAEAIKMMVQLPRRG